MITTKLKRKTTELIGKVTDFMSGEITLTKLDFFLISAICLLAGICIGLLTAPLTHGVTIGSNNGNNNGHNITGTEPCKLDKVDDSQEQDQM